MRVRLDVVGAFWQFFIVFGGFAAVLTFVGWVGVRARRNNVGGSVIDVFDQVWHPIAHDQFVEIAQHDERGAAKSLPGDRPDWLLGHVNDRVNDESAPTEADAPSRKKRKN